MRTLALALSTIIALAVTGCSSDMYSEPTPEPGGSNTTQVDAEKFAARLEQVFSGSTYPTDLAGAYATYDTSPMSVQDSGNSGGCP